MREEKRKLICRVGFLAICLIPTTVQHNNLGLFRNGPSCAVRLFHLKQHACAITAERLLAVGR